MGIAAMVLGILGLILSFVPCLGMYALPLTGLAVILGALGLRTPKDGVPRGKGMAIAGLVTGLIGSILGAYWLYIWMHIKNDASMGDFRKGFNEGIQKALREEAEKTKHDLRDIPDPPAPDKAEPAEKPEPTTPAQ
jgi:hypothetical protein